MGVSLKGTTIATTLANADLEARTTGALKDSEMGQAWLPEIDLLLEPSAPKTYIAVFTTTVVARAMFEPDVLDVRAIQTGSSDKGYSAASIAKQVAAFAKEHRIDLRATSSQPMNNQPFTYRAYLDRTIPVNPRGAEAWEVFHDLLDRLQPLASSEAQALLAVIFDRCRRKEGSALTLHLHGDKAVYDDVLEAVCAFVDTTASNGRIGQAFAASLLDCVHGPDAVVLGALHDPDVTRPGDVHVGVPTPWLWAEVKQKVVVTGDVEGFLDKVGKAGGDRVVYFALANGAYGANLIKARSVQRRAGDLGIQVHVLTSSADAASWVLALAVGSLAAVATTLLERLHARMVEAGCSPDDVTALEDLASTL